MTERFLPMTRAEMNAYGWDELDFLFISGDAYVDHPSFGPAIICRHLEAQGYRVGIIAQPNWHTTKDFKVMGKPRLGVLISAGNLDSMLNKFTAAKKFRHNDDYSPGGEAGKRPDRATVVYANRAREIWKDTPIIVGGIEASLRRFAHYDYWSDKVRRSMLLDSRADMLIFGMGEKQISEIAERLAAGVPIHEIRDVQGTCYRTEKKDELPEGVWMPSYEAVVEDKKAFAKAFRLMYLEQDAFHGKKLIQPSGTSFVVQNPPAMPMTTEEMDAIYALPYQRTWHPAYDEAGGVPAIAEVKFSLVSQRGCFGGCSFCAITTHQGRIIQARSHESILTEAKKLIADPEFKGYIHDVGGPTANFRQPACSEQLKRGVCSHRQCLAPVPCKNLHADHRDYIALLRKLRKLPGVKKVFIRSGIRYDYLLLDKNTDFLRELCEHHVSGQLKVAPEHISARVLKYMSKSSKETYQKFASAYEKVNRQLGKKQYLVPYFMSSHPGATLADAIELAEFLRDLHYMPQQVQDFIPTPGSLSTCMYYTGIHPLTGESLYVARNANDKKMQRALLQYRKSENYEIVYQALRRANRMDLVGYGPKCLLRPPKKDMNKKVFTSSYTRGRQKPKQRMKKQW